MIVSAHRLTVPAVTRLAETGQQVIAEPAPHPIDRDPAEFQSVLGPVGARTEREQVELQTVNAQVVTVHAPLTIVLAVTRLAETGQQVIAEPAPLPIDFDPAAGQIVLDPRPHVTPVARLIVRGWSVLATP